MHLETANVVRHDTVGEGGYRLLSMNAPVVVRMVRPGQFVHLLVPRLGGAVLRRPFSVYKAEDGILSILYKPVGRGTQVMTEIKPGEQLNIMGPLGNGFPLDIGTDQPVLIAGGYGMAPLYLVAKTLKEKAGLLFVGGASSCDILCVDEFKALGWTVVTATQDGTEGIKGLVTKPLDDWLVSMGKKSLQFFACGPNGMLKAVGERAMARKQKAWLSLDRHMGCGAGACLACVQKVRRGNEVVWARVCKDGPIFEAGEIVWEEA